MKKIYILEKKNPPQQQHLDTKYIEKKIENSFVSHFGFRYLKSNLVCVTLKWIKKTKKKTVVGLDEKKRAWIVLDSGVMDRF